MLPTLQIAIMFIFSYVVTVKGNDEAIMVKLRPGQIIDTFKSLISSDYLKELANDFAVKAAEHFIDVMRNQGNVTSGHYRSPLKQKKKNMKSEKELLNEREVWTLLNKPLPDGDNLFSSEFSVEEDNKITRKKKKIPIIELRKINGAYYRRLLGLI